MTYPRKDWWLPSKRQRWPQWPPRSASSFRSFRRTLLIHFPPLVHILFRYTQYYLHVCSHPRLRNVWNGAGESEYPFETSSVASAAFKAASTATIAWEELFNEAACEGLSLLVSRMQQDTLSLIRKENCHACIAFIGRIHQPNSQDLNGTLTDNTSVKRSIIKTFYLFFIRFW